MPRLISKYGEEVVADSYDHSRFKVLPDPE